ncbi:MAG: DNA polymerase III subunit gamma/tau [Elusimicrobiales bacterium]|jgi:DNA polymerase-3 subunit gamma/tau
MYENLATKYRPRNLEEVMGQETIKTTLANSVKLGRLAHAYVFYGPRGCGKTTIARILAKTLNCAAPRDGKPCDKCASCVEIAESKSLDVIEIDAASHTDVDNVRSVIIENVGLAPSRDKYKIYILDEVHMLSKQSFNALLKTIEEPPAHVVFVMATTEQTKVPVTILSRSQCFRFRPIPEDLIVGRLREVVAGEKLKVSDAALAVIAGSAGGAMRDALTLLDRAASFGKGAVELEVLNELLGHASPDLIQELALALVKRDAAALYAGFEKISREGYDPITILRDLRNSLSETFLNLQGFSRTATPLSAALGKDCPPMSLARLSRKLNTVIDEVKFSDSPALASEIALFTLVETPQDLDSLVKRLESLEGRPASGVPVPAEPLPVPESGSVQKKNEKPAAIAARPGGSALTSPVPPASPGLQPPPPVPYGLPSPALWKRLLGAISVKKPLLYNTLLSVRVVFESENVWKLSSAVKFEAGIIEKARKELEETLERVAGRKIGLTVEHNAAAAAAQLRTEAEGQALGSAGITGEDCAEAAVGPAPGEIAASPGPDSAGPAGDEPEFKHLNKVFHGRITRIQKIK